jgi:hypothetical protein
MAAIASLCGEGGAGLPSILAINNALIGPESGEENHVKKAAFARGLGISGL